MAHDFKIEHKESGDKAWFFGYANGLLYLAFNAQFCDGGLSGTGATVERGYEETKAALEFIIPTIKTSYPDPHRADELEEFLKKMEHHPKDSVYKLLFC